MTKNVIILIGRGKTTLTDFFLGENSHGFIHLFINRKSLRPKEIAKIKDNPELKFIIHSELDVSINSLGLRGRAFKFKLDI